MAKNNTVSADPQASLKFVLKTLMILAIVVFLASPFVVMFTPGNKILVTGVLILLQLVLIYRVFKFRKDINSEPVVETLQFHGFDYSGKHTFLRKTGKRIKIIYIPLELQNAFVDEGVYEVHYLKHSKVFAKVVGGKYNEKRRTNKSH